MFKQLRKLILAAGLCGAVGASAADLEAILKKADGFRLAPSSAQVETLVQTIKGGQAEREKRFQVLLRPGRKSLVLFRSPGEEGQKVLMVGDDFWMLLPGSARPIRITPLQKLLGNASSGDIATMTWSGDYGAVLLRETEFEGVPCLELELNALRKALNYQRIVLRVGRRDYRPLQADLYAASGRKLKQARFVLEMRDGLERVTRIILSDEVEKGRETVISTLKVTPREFDDQMFNPMFLSRAGVAP